MAVTVQHHINAIVATAAVVAVAIAALTMAGWPVHIAAAGVVLTFLLPAIRHSL